MASDVPATTALADVLDRSRVVDHRIRALYAGAPPIAGPAYTVRCTPGDNLMLHAAIHRAEPGSVIVVESGDTDYALAGGNVCAVARRRGVAGFVLDGMVRDVAEIRAMGFGVYALGAMPIPGTKKSVEPLNTVIRCGGVDVAPGDIVVADEEGVVVVPGGRAGEVLAAARAKAAKDDATSLSDWEREHRERIDAILRDGGYEG